MSAPFGLLEEHARELRCKVAVQMRDGWKQSAKGGAHWLADAARELSTEELGGDPPDGEKWVVNFTDESMIPHLEAAIETELADIEKAKIRDERKFEKHINSKLIEPSERTADRVATLRDKWPHSMESEFFAIHGRTPRPFKRVKVLVRGLPPKPNESEVAQQRVIAMLRDAGITGAAAGGTGAAEIATAVVNALVAAGVVKAGK